MKSSNREYLASVDHLRAFAALLIVFYHGAQLFSAQVRPEGFQWLYSGNPAETLIFEGHTAVALFMVLSGFIFTTGTLGHGVSFPRFMVNRLLRIYPLFLLLAFVGVAANPGSFTLRGFVQVLFGMDNLPGAMNLGAVSGMFWAIAVEMQFYLLFPFLNSILTRFGLPTFARLLVAVVVVRGLIWELAAHHDVYNMLYLNIAGRIDQFLLGMIAAWVFVRHREWVRGWWKVILSVALAVALLWGFNQIHGFASDGTWRLAAIDVEGGGWALVIATYVATVKAQNIVSRAVAKIGELSYSIYLLHSIVITVAIRKGWYLTVDGLSPVGNALLTTLAVVIPIVLIASVTTYYGVEQPFLRMRVRYLLPAPVDGPVDGPVAATSAEQAVEPRTGTVVPSQSIRPDERVPVSRVAAGPTERE